MPISIVVGGQFGSEGKGKIAHHIARQMNAVAVVRVGGPNSGHTVYSDDGRKFIFQHLPTAAVLPSCACILATGTYIDAHRLLHEVSHCGLDAKRLKIDPQAIVISQQDCVDEHLVGLREGIGSTLTGTGAAVLSRISRVRPVTFAKDIPELQQFLCDTKQLLGTALARGDRVVIEGTQGYGLSVLHTPYYPFATSRDTTAAAFLSEVGLSPLDVDDVALVIRAFPIRVPGNSGPLPNETSWTAVSENAGALTSLAEMTSVTKAVRRVAKFDAQIVKAAMLANRPSRIFLNHADYFDVVGARTLGLSAPKISAGVSMIEAAIGRHVDFVGLSGTVLSSRVDNGPVVRHG